MIKKKINDRVKTTGRKVEDGLAVKESARKQTSGSGDAESPLPLKAFAVNLF
jgi:hypothetical protein